MAPIVLITKLAALAEAVAELRESQRHAAQAAAARAAAERLYAAARPAPPAQPRPAPRASTAAQLAALSFPQPATPGRQPPAPGQPGPDPGGPRPAHAGRHHHGHAAPAADRTITTPKAGRKIIDQSSSRVVGQPLGSVQMRQSC